MYSVDGQNYRTKDEYEAVLRDKKIIDELKRRYDFSRRKDVEECYRVIQNVRFSSEVGRNFDDFIFELKNSEKTADINIKSIQRGSKGKKEKGATQKVTSGKKSPERELGSDNPELEKAVYKELKRQYRKRKLIVAVLMVVSFCSIGYFVRYYQIAYESERQAREYAALKNVELPDTIVKAEPKKHYSQEVIIPDILDEYKALYNKNQSIIGWVKIDGTKIDYPVMQTVNNDYYLKHNFNQQEDVNGCIFLDKDCDVILGCTNYIIYGHHMKSGRMFGSLVKYGSEAFYKEHDTISFDTIYEKGTYQIMYVFRSHIYNSDEIVFKYYQFIQANSEAEFNSAMEEMAKMSLYDTGVTAHYGDQLLTLSTCDYQEANGRFAVVAKRIK